MPSCRTATSHKSGSRTPPGFRSVDPKTGLRACPPHPVCRRLVALGARAARRGRSRRRAATAARCSAKEQQSWKGAVRYRAEHVRSLSSSAPEAVVGAACGVSCYVPARRETEGAVVRRADHRVASGARLLGACDARHQLRPSGRGVGEDTPERSRADRWPHTGCTDRSLGKG